MLLAVFNYRKVPKILVSGRMFLYIQIPITSFLLPCNSTLSEHFGAFRFTANWFFWKFLICKIRKYCKLHAYKINCNDQQSKTFADPSTIGFYFIWFIINYPGKKTIRIFEWPFWFLCSFTQEFTQLRTLKFPNNLFVTSKNEFSNSRI